MSEPLYPYFRDLELLTDDDLRDRFDYDVTPGHLNSARAEFFRNELRRRESAQILHESLRIGRRTFWLTVSMAVMTIAIAFLTAVNVFAVFSDDSHGNHDRYESGHHARR